MIGRRLFLFLERTWDNFRLSLIASLMNLLTLSILLFFLGIFFLLSSSARLLFPSWVTSSRIVVYLKADTSATDQADLIRELDQWPEIDGILAVSREEARRQLEAQVGEWRGIVEGLDESFLPPSLEITLKSRGTNREGIERFSNKIRQYPRVEEVFYGNGGNEKLEFIINSVKFGGLGIAAFFAVAIVVIVFNTSRAALLARRDELEIYSIVGATRFFIAIPFYLEGLFQGFAGSIVANGLLICAITISQKALPLPLASALSWKTPQLFLLALGLLTCGVIFSCLGCWLALERFHRDRKAYELLFRG